MFRWYALAVFLLSLPLIAQNRPVRVLFLGDSITEGYQLSKEEAFPYLIEQRLKAEGREVVCINAGISGSATASAVSRLKWHLKEKPDVMVLALGANDGLRGLDPKLTKANLQSVIRLAKGNKIKILFAGMKMPPNLGLKYTKEYEAVFVSLANEEKVPFIPFLLEGTATKRDLNLADGIHPNSAGHKVLAELVLKHLRNLF